MTVEISLVTSRAASRSWRPSVRSAVPLAEAPRPVPGAAARPVPGARHGVGRRRGARLRRESWRGRGGAAASRTGARRAGPLGLRAGQPGDDARRGRPVPGAQQVHRQPPRPGKASRRSRGAGRGFASPARDDRLGGSAPLRIGRSATAEQSGHRVHGLDQGAIGHPGQGLGSFGHPLCHVQQAPDPLHLAGHLTGGFLDPLHGRQQVAANLDQQAAQVAQRPAETHPDGTQDGHRHHDGNTGQHNGKLATTHGYSPRLSPPRAVTVRRTRWRRPRRVGKPTPSVTMRILAPLTVAQRGDGRRRSAHAPLGEACSGLAPDRELRSRRLPNLSLDLHYEPPTGTRRTPASG